MLPQEEYCLTLNRNLKTKPRHRLRVIQPAAFSFTIYRYMDDLHLLRLAFVQDGVGNFQLFYGSDICCPLKTYNAFFLLLKAYKL